MYFLWARIDLLEKGKNFYKRTYCGQLTRAGNGARGKDNKNGENRESIKSMVILADPDLNLFESSLGICQAHGAVHFLAPSNVFCLKFREIIFSLISP